MIGYHPIQGEVEILLFSACYKNWILKHWPYGPLGSDTDVHAH